MDRPLVLVVDDEDGLRAILHDALVDEGYQVHVAANVADALAVLDGVHVDAVVLDIQMPGLDGFAFLDGYRRKGLPGCPVVAISANMNRDMEQRLAEEGVVDRLSKPFHLERVLECVARTVAAQASVHRP